MTLPPAAPYAPAPQTITSSPIPSVNDWNSHTNWILTAIDPPRCSVFNSTTQSPTTAVVTLQSWDSEDYDTDALHSTVTNTSRLVAVAAGTYQLTGAVTFSANATGIRAVVFRKNAAGSNSGGSLIAESNTGLASSTQPTTALVVKEVQLALNDYVEMFVYQNSGAGLATVANNYLTWASMRWVAKS